MKKMSAKKWMLMCMVMAAVLLTGCGQNGLPEKFDEEAVRAGAMKSIEYFNQRDYQSIVDMGDERLRTSITAEEFAAAADPFLDKCGKFVEISKTILVGNKDKETGMEYGGVVMVGKYEDGKIQFTIAFDENMDLVQFLIK